MPDNTNLIKLLTPEEQQAWAEIHYKVLSQPYELVNYLDTLINSPNFKVHKKFFSGKILYEEHPLFSFFASSYACSFFESEFIANPLSGVLLGDIFNRILLLSTDFRGSYALENEINDFYSLLAWRISSSQIKNIIKHAKIPKNFFCGSPENKFILIRNISNFAPHLWPVFIDNHDFFQRLFRTENGNYDIEALLEILTSQLPLENINAILVHVFKKDPVFAKAFSKHTIEFLPNIKIPLVTILTQSNEYKAQPFYKRHLAANVIVESSKHTFIISKIRQLYAFLESANSSKISDEKDEHGVSLAFFMGEYCASLGLLTPKHREKTIIEYRKLQNYYHKNPTKQVSFDFQNLLLNIVIHILLPTKLATKNPILHGPILQETFAELFSLNFLVKDLTELTETELALCNNIAGIKSFYKEKLAPSNPLTRIEEHSEKAEEFSSEYTTREEKSLNEEHLSLDSILISSDENTLEGEQKDNDISSEDSNQDDSSTQGDEFAEEYGFDSYPNILKVRTDLHHISNEINTSFGNTLLATVSGKSEEVAVNYWTKFSIPTSRKLISITRELDPNDILSIALSKFAYELLGTLFTINAFILHPEFTYCLKNGFIKIANWGKKENKHALFSLAASYFEESPEGIASHPETAYNYCLCLYYLMHYSPDKDKAQARDKLFAKYETAAKEFPQLFQESFLLQEFKNHKIKEKSRKKKKTRQLKHSQLQQAKIEQTDILQEAIESDTDSSSIKDSPDSSFISDAVALASPSLLKSDGNRSSDEENTMLLEEQDTSYSESNLSGTSTTELDNPDSSDNTSESENEINAEIIHAQEQLLYSNSKQKAAPQNTHTQKKLTFQFQLAVNNPSIKTAEQFILEKKQQTIRVFQYALEKAHLPYNILSELTRQFHMLTPNNLIQMAFEKHTFNQPSYTIWIGEQDLTDPYYKLYSSQKEPIIVRKTHQQGLTWNKTQGYKLRLHGDPREHGLELSVSVIDKKGMKHCYLIVLFGVSDEMRMKHNEYNRKNARSKYEKMSLIFETIDQAEMTAKIAQSSKKIKGL